nr:phospholipid carrier-dependent glycosyltransferase [Candidatus Eremiobacteraeota bacterium]
SHDPTYGWLKALVKLPAIIMDLVDAALVYAIVLRFANVRTALIGAALVALNPAIIYISAAWGQVDSVAAGLALLAVWLLLCSDDDNFRSRASWLIAIAWLALTYSILIKPQAAILIPLFLAFALAPLIQRRLAGTLIGNRGSTKVRDVTLSRFRQPGETVVEAPPSDRLLGTAIGIVASLILTWLVTLPFHPTSNPIDSFGWLYGKYLFGKNVYPYNSVNAFNLWTIKFAFWQLDSQRIFLFPQYVWGLLLLVAASVLTLVRYLQTRTPRALLESAAVLLLAFYMLSTRMHERYLFDGLLFITPLVFVGRRYFWCAVLLSGTLFADLMYSLQYMHVMEQHISTVNAQDLMPALSRSLSLLNVVIFFYLGYIFLGSAQEMPTSSAAPMRAVNVRLAPARNWFDPREGLARMLWPIDYVLAGAIGIGAFVLSYVNYWLPPEKIFDEVYFPRAAEEYLKGLAIYESTHPPLTKLLITLSVMLFGGLKHGDNAAGWRFLDVVFGALVVVLLYIFAKRITGSSLFASITALLLTFDGMHFVQSRISTPEGFVVFFSLATMYAFYRFWIASQVQVRPSLGERQILLTIAGAVAALILAVWISFTVFHTDTLLARVIAAIYFWLGLYLVVRLLIVPILARSGVDFISYPEGSYALREGDRLEMHAPDGGVVDTQKKTPTVGDLSREDKGALVMHDDRLRIQYQRDGSVLYETPDGNATYTPGHLVTDSGEAQDGRSAKWWLIVFVVLLGCLVSSKWYGVMGFGVSIFIILAIWIQQHLASLVHGGNHAGKRRAAVWGNPFGFPLDITLVTIAFISLSVYAAVWIPQLIRHIEIQSLSDLVQRQIGMYDYHAHLVATHPYASVWWQWPLDLRPVLYYAHYGYDAHNTLKTAAVILSLPNPLILWVGLITVPIVGYLGWTERNKGYALLVIAYLSQWLPWSRSPRIAFAYHFYVDIPLICLCSAIVLQRIWLWGTANAQWRTWSRIIVFGYVAVVGLTFVYFYPVLAGSTIPYGSWLSRMWIGSWIR